jgi:hypothetical protein
MKAIILGAALAVGAAVLLVGSIAKAAVKDVTSGASGKRWRLTPNKDTDEYSWWTIWAEKNQFGPHTEFAVLQFRESKADGVRYVTFRHEGVPDVAYNTAMADWHIQTGAQIPAV